MFPVFRAPVLSLWRNAKINRHVNCVSTTSFSSSSNSNDSNNSDGPTNVNDEEPPKTDVKKKSSEAKSKAEERLKSLLGAMPSKSTKSIETAKPRGYETVKTVKNPKNRTDPKATQNIEKAAEDVAKVIGGDKQETMSKLMSMVRTSATDHIDDLLRTPSTSRGKRDRKVDDRFAKIKQKEQKEPFTVSTLQKKKVDAVESYEGADQFFSQSDRKKGAEKIESVPDFVDSVLKNNETAIRRPHTQPKRGRVQTEHDFDLPTQSGSRLRRTTPAVNSGSVDLFSGKKLGIFSASSIQTERSDSQLIWNALEKYENDLSLMKIPKNYYEKMILWTEDGKIWHFPIDNEQGLDDEAKVSFAEHVFLEHLLESWCPKTGPVRVFMELVCVGLSKNPYLTVDQKHEHIEWYQNYFHEKKDLLDRVEMHNKEDERQPNSSAPN